MKNIARHAATGWLLVLSAFASVNAHASAPAGAWWDGNYTYRQQVSVAAGGSALVTAYSTSVTFDHATQVGAGRSLASGNDVRVVYWNGTTWVELDRIVDPDTTWNSATSKVWFRTQAAIAGGGTDDNYYLYYGFTGTSTPSSTTPLTATTNIFLFYDDFSSAALDTTTRWTNNGATQAGSVLTVAGNTQIRSQAVFGNATIWETRAKLSSASAPTGSFSYWAANSSGTFALANDLRFFSSTIANHTAEDTLGVTTTQTFAPTSPTAFQMYSITREGTTTSRFLVNGAQVASLTHAASNATLRILLRNDAAAAQTQQYQWALVRNYRNPEPTASLGGQATFTPVPIASYSFEETTWNGTAGEVKDSSANALNGTARGTTTTANATPAIAGNTGTCRYGTFNGTNSFVQIPTAAPLNPTTAVGFAAWVRHRTNSYKAWETILAKGDSTYRIHLNGGCNINGTLGTSTANAITEGLNSGCATADLNSNQLPAANTWYHVGATFRNGEMRVYINGVLINSAAFSPPTVATTALDLAIGENLQNTGRLWDGDVDEVTLWDQPVSQATIQAHMAATHACSVVPHFVIQHDGSGIHCVGENITVFIRDAANNPYTGYNQQITLDTGSGKGDWSLVTGSGTLNNGTANDGIATYQWPLGESSAVFALSYKEGAATININAYQTSNVTIRDDDTEGTMTWSANGFTVTSSPLGNPPPAAIPAFASPQTAGTTFNVYLTAYGTTPTDTQCGVIEAYTGTKNVKLWSTYANPASGTLRVAINGTSIVTSEAAAIATQAVTFLNGQATVTAKYKDVGQIAISLKDDVTTPSLLSTFRGSTGNFISKPASIALAAITRTNGSVNAPPITDQNSSVFIGAGRPFRTTVTVRDFENSATPNFGLETPPESVGLVPTLVSPTIAGSNNPPVAQVGTHTYSGGVATNVDFSWPEVGIITMTPHISDSDYLGVGDVSGAATTSIGRFIPDHFDLSANVPVLQTACGLFTYLGQPFRYSTAPVVTATAKAFTGETTKNYTGVYNKLTNSSIARTYQPSAGLDTSFIPAGDVNVVPLTGANVGLATISFTLGTTPAEGLAYARGTTPVAPVLLPAAISLQVTATDSDGAASLPSPFTIGAAGGIAFSGSTEQRYGRMAFRNAVGSELLNLPLTLHSEYFVSTAVGFVQSLGDSCTTGVSVNVPLVTYGGNLNSGETCFLDTGSPGLSGFGCPVAGPVLQRFQMPPSSGDFNAILQAPGSGNSGTVTVTTTVPTWLRYDWNTSSAGLESPSGVATFGIFQGESKRIFQTEK